MVSVALISFKYRFLYATTMSIQQLYFFAYSIALSHLYNFTLFLINLNYFLSLINKFSLSVYFLK